jgi:hypothetical protein
MWPQWNIPQENRTEETIDNAESSSKGCEIESSKTRTSAVLPCLWQKIRVVEETTPSNSLLWFCLYLFHRGFTAPWDACGFTSARLINDQDKSTFFTLVFRTLLCHAPSPPQFFAVQKTRVTLGYKSIQETLHRFESAR